jgi:cysteine desulfurase/selenocysteine lyase
MTRLGVTSTVRASIALYNTEDEIDVLAEAVAKAQSFFA